MLAVFLGRVGGKEVAGASRSVRSVHNPLIPSLLVQALGMRLRRNLWLLTATIVMVPMGIIFLLEGERSYQAPCVVLVINDNPYGLMVAFSYMCRTCP
jgi:hypothetical protein